MLTVRSLPVCRCWIAPSAAAPAVALATPTARPAPLSAAAAPFTLAPSPGTSLPALPHSARTPPTAPWHPMEQRYILPHPYLWQLPGVGAIDEQML